jgi:hypothetical protein
LRETVTVDRHWLSPEQMTRNLAYIAALRLISAAHWLVLRVERK